VSSDGYALEAPTSTLIWLDGETLYTVPVERTGILAGTTGRWLLDHASELGWSTGERMITPAELTESGGAWFTSSVRGLAAIREVDGTPSHSPDHRPRSHLLVPKTEQTGETILYWPTI
jgi:4-amino-4-deoxychorismate lyase